jgi:hypothetical protein
MGSRFRDAAFDRSRPQSGHSRDAHPDFGRFEEAIGLGVTGERDAWVPVVSVGGRRLEHQVAPRAVHPIGDLEATVAPTPLSAACQRWSTMSNRPARRIEFFQDTTATGHLASS